MRNLVFNSQDFEFIKNNYFNLYTILFSKSLIKGNKIYYPLHSESEYDYIFDIFGDYIGESLDSNGELSKNGLNLERIWDYADGAEDWS